jgi:SAM-dependent methyltransferase
MIIRSEKDLRELRRNWHACQVILALARSGLFDGLARSGADTGEALARRHGLDPRALELCADILVGHGLLTFRGGRYGLAPAAEGLLPVIAEISGELDDLAALERCLRTGQPNRPTSGGVIPADLEATRKFLGELHRGCRGAAEVAARLVSELCGSLPLGSVDGPRILDLGGGHGRFAAKFADRIPAAHVTLFDHQAVIPIAQELSGNGFRAISGDYMRDDLGGPYDLIFVSNVLHFEPVDSCVKLLRRVRRSLSEAGVVLVKDMFLNDSRVGPPHAADFGLTLLFETREGRPKTVLEAREILGMAAFSRLEHFELPGEEYGFLVGSCLS